MASARWTPGEYAAFRARRLGSTVKEVFAKTRPVALPTEANQKLRKAANQAKHASNKQKESDAKELLASQLVPHVYLEWEYAFDPVRKWRFDGAIHTRKLAIEIEGGIYQQGRHNRASGFIADIEKYNAAAILGWRVLRFTYAMIKDGTAAETIRRALA